MNFEKGHFSLENLEFVLHTILFHGDGKEFASARPCALLILGRNSSQVQFETFQEILSFFFLSSFTMTFHQTLEIYTVS